MPKAKKQTFQTQGMGELAFFVGLLLAIVAGFFTLPLDVVTIILIILGLVVGFLNITSKETTGFLIASVALLVAGSAGLDKIPLIGGWVYPILINIITFVTPAALIVALKAVYQLARKK
jgi:chromate transport protein ChrA